jgi:tellurite methyltransferase
MSDGYWDGWYQNGGAPVVPSQFAVMVAQHAQNVARIVDFGCGNGRDSLLLDTVAPTLGVDASPEAVRVAAERLPHIRFVCGSVEKVTGEPGLLYARFLLHSLTEEVEDMLLDRVRGWQVAFEFRTPEDVPLPKVTPDHYRRPVDPDLLVDKLEGRGFTVTYRVEGRGMARWRDDDAHVCRLMAHSL